MDPELLLAYQEVDALTPATPPIAPVYGPEEGPLVRLDDIRRRQELIQLAVRAAKDTRSVERYRAEFYELDHQAEAMELARRQQSVALRGHFASNLGALANVPHLMVPVGTFPEPGRYVTVSRDQYRALLAAGVVYVAHDGCTTLRRA